MNCPNIFWKRVFSDIVSYCYDNFHLKFDPLKPLYKVTQY